MLSESLCKLGRGGLSTSPSKPVSVRTYLIDRESETPQRQGIDRERGDYPSVSSQKAGRRARVQGREAPGQGLGATLLGLAVERGAVSQDHRQLLEAGATGNGFPMLA